MYRKNCIWALGPRDRPRSVRLAAASSFPRIIRDLVEYLTSFLYLLPKAAREPDKYNLFRASDVLGPQEQSRSALLAAVLSSASSIRDSEVCSTRCCDVCQVLFEKEIDTAVQSAKFGWCPRSPPEGF